MDSDNETFDDYSIEFDDDEAPQAIESDSDSPSKPQNKPKPNGTPRKTNSQTLSCRICLKRCSKQSKNCSEFAEIYLKCTGFSFEDVQGPTKLCFPCMNELLKVENFIEKCSETEEKLSKGLKNDISNDDISDIDDFDVVIEGEEESDASNFSDTIKKKPAKSVGKPIKPAVTTPNGPRIERRGRRPLSPSQRKPKPMKGPRGRPKGSFKILKDSDSSPRVVKPKGRPRNSFKKEDDELSEERQICFVCGKFVRKKQLPHHLWLHRKNEEAGEKAKTEGIVQHICEFCNTIYKSLESKIAHMKRIHPAVVFGMPVRESPEPQEEDMRDDNFEREFHVPTPKEVDYPPIQSPYDHHQAIIYMQKGGKR